jgi:hypothetical protein
MPSPVLLISLPPAARPAGGLPWSWWSSSSCHRRSPAAGGSFGGPDDVGEQHRGQQPLGPPGNLELQGVDHDVEDASREVDVVTVGCLVEVGGLPGGLASYRLGELVVEGHLAPPRVTWTGGGASGPMDGDLAGPRNRSRTAPAGWAALLRSPWGVLDLHAEELDRAGRPAGSPGPSGTWISALIGQERRVLTLQGGESPLPDSGSPVVPHDGGRNVAEPSASNAGQRPVSRRQALAYDSSLAAATPPPSGAPDKSACRCSLWWSTTAA